MSEQERADQLARDIDRLLAGEQISGDEPVLDAARQFATLSLQPSLQAQQRFEQQLAQWFGGPSSPPMPRQWSPPRVVTIALWIAVGAIIGFVLASGGQRREPAPTVVPTVTSTITISPSLTSTTQTSRTPSLTPTASQTPTDIAATLTAIPTTTAPISATPITAKSTPLTFVKIIVSGSIESIQGNVISILGQSITIEGGVNGLCTGDLVQLEATFQDGVFHAQRATVKVNTSACPPPNTGVGPSSGNNGNGSSPGGKGGKGNDDD